MAGDRVRVAAVRRLAIAAQGFAGRDRRARTTDLEAAIRRLSCVPLDSIWAMQNGGRRWYGEVERTHAQLSGVDDALDRALARRARTIGLAEVAR